MKICKRCVVPENFPHVTFDDKGVCSLCRNRIPKGELKRLGKEYEGRFRALIKKHAGRGVYDILMCYSGGKDSTYTLHLLKDVYKLKILAFTFDNGFVPERTYINIKNVVEKLDVDHIFFKPRFGFLKKIFNAAARRRMFSPKALERASGICTACMGIVKYASLKLAIEKEIPLIGFGWSPGQAPVTSSVMKIDPAMIKSMERALKGPMAEAVGGEVEPYFLEERHYSKPGNFPYFVHPLGFSGYDEKKILKKIEAFGWKKPYGIDLNATNCLLNSFADEVHIAKYGLHPYILEIAAFVRDGYMTREEGLRHLPVKKNRKVVNMVKRKLGV
jgi:tRNA(Ile)-lysidine synthase TilS/MesJ